MSNVTKAIFFDVDGTLISHTTNEVPEGTREVLDKLRDKGIKRVVATGRHMSELDMLPVKDIKFDGYITLNGQLVLDGEGNIIYENPIVGDDKKALINLFNEKNIPVALVEKDRMYINYVNQYVESAQQAVSTPVPTVGEYTGEKIYLAIVYLGKEDEHIMSTKLPGCKATRWNDYGVDVIASSGGKAQGIKQYMKATGIVDKETMAFGDGINDIEMLRVVNIGVAMGNAVMELKDEANYVTASVDKNGIARALNFYDIFE